MITDHEMVSTETEAMVQAQIPTALDRTHQAKIDTLKSLKGEDCTKQYHSDRVAGHKNTVDSYKRYAADGDDAELKAFAAKHLLHLE